MRSYESIELAVRLSVGCVFLWAALTKLMRPMAFAEGVIQYGILPPRLSFIGAFVVMALELAVGIAHLGGWFVVRSAEVGLLVLVTFLIVVCRQLVTGRVAPCYCFGSGGGDVLSGRSVARLILMCAGELVVVLTNNVAGGSMASIMRSDRREDLLLTLTASVVICVMSAWGLNAKEFLCLTPGWPLSKQICFGEDI